MNSQSPIKTTSARILFSKNIRLNLNSKFLPQDFFPDSISQFSKKKNKQEKQSQCKSSRIKSSYNFQNLPFEKEAKNIELLKKRLMKIRESESELMLKKKVFYQKLSTPKKGEKKIINGLKQREIFESESKNIPKKYSKNLMEYMQKMKDVINIDIKFQDDSVEPIFHHSKETKIENSSLIETEDSPKNECFRSRSQLVNRDQLMDKSKYKLNIEKFESRPLKIKVKETNQLMRQSKQKMEYKKNGRYKKFVDIQLNEEGMLTFHCDSPKKQNHNDSKRYKMIASLPKLQK